MKKNFSTIFVIAIITIVAIIIIMLTQIDSEQISESKSMKTSLYSNYENLKTFYAEADNHSEVIDHLYTWGTENGFSSSKDGNILTITKPASEEYHTAPTTSLHIDVDLDDSKSLAQSTSIALSTLLGTSDYGEVSVIFTPSNHFDYYGAKSIPSTMLDADNLISLRYGEDSGLTIATASQSEISLSSNLNYTTPSYENAYTITVSGISMPNNSYNIIYEKNPITELCDFMSTLNDDSIYFEYSNLEAGSSGEKFPYSVSVTLLFDDRNEDTFLRRIASLEEKFESYYKDDYPDYSFSCNEVPVPSKVITQEDGLRVLGFIYTLADRIRDIEEDQLISVAVLNQISTSNNLSISMVGYSTDDMSQQELSDNLTKSAGLSKLSISIKETIPKWNSSIEGNQLLESLEENLSNAGAQIDPPFTTFLPSSAGYFQLANPEINQIIFNTNNTESFEQTTALLEFIKNLKE